MKLILSSCDFGNPTSARFIIDNLCKPISECKVLYFPNNARELVNQGVPVSNVIAYRDDVFNHIEKHMLRKGMSNTGYAYKIMEDTRRGDYFRGGVSDEMKKQLKDIEVEDWFVDSIEKIQYLFPKAHGVTYVKLAATLMWYKINYPKEFNEIML